MTRSFDFVIVGGGVFGTALAWELSRRDASVALLEAQRIGAGASGGPGKRGVRASSRDERELPLSRIANDIWPALAAEIDAPTGYERTGGLELFENESTRERAATQAALQEGFGIRSRLIERDELRALEPGLSDRVIGAVSCPDDGVVDHSATTAGLAAAAAGAGASIFENTAARSLERGGHRVGGIITASERFAARREVVLLANFGVVGLLAPLGIELKIGRVFPQVLLTEPLPVPRVRHLVGHMERRVVVKQLPDRGVMISGGWLGRWNDAAQRGEAVPDQVVGNFDEACEVFPALRAATISAAFADRAEAVGPDLLPVIDRVPGLENVIAATGWSGHGFAIAPAVSRLLASWLLDGRRPPELEPFRWRH